ncbi:RHS repeat domain-containing protein [Paenibacillus sp. NPDC057934]|uniref:RHS repeat domain-containing protein n=1 Tax=Paenibacillus sp. NPDC057934 TaxID=3346282 RepID=UPI0036DA7BC1
MKKRKNFEVKYISLFVALFFILVPNNISSAESTYSYDQNGRLLQQKNSTGETVKYEYDKNGNLLTKFFGEPFFDYSSSYGSEQGKDNWYYQIWNGTKYEDMTWDATNSRWKGKNDWDLITKEWMHPDGNDVALKWSAPQSGSVRITGSVSKHPVNLEGDGVRVKVMKNNTQIWPVSGWQTIQGNDAVGVTLNLDVNVSGGDAIYFIVNQNGHIGSDATRWNPIISYIERASSAYGSEQGKDNWYYQIWNGTKYEDMTWDAANLRWKGKNDWDLITKEWMHPDGNDVALKWSAPQSGSVRIAGNVSKHSVNLEGDGVRVKVMKNNTQIWPASGWQTIQGKDAIGVTLNLNVNVNKGDSIYFIVNQNGHIGSDATKWNPVISYIERASSAYGSEQGKDNWYYQIWNGTKYEDMTWDVANSRWKGKNNWDLITKEWMHPDGNDVALKWSAPQSGSVRVAGSVSKHPVNLEGDGVRVKVMKNNTQIWPVSGWQTIQGNDAIGVALNLTVNVNKGDAIYFVVNQNGDFGWDATRWNPTIFYQDKQLGNNLILNSNFENMDLNNSAKAASWDMEVNQNTRFELTKDSATGATSVGQ